MDYLKQEFFLLCTLYFYSAWQQKFGKKKDAILEKETVPKPGFYQLVRLMHQIRRRIKANRRRIHKN